MKTSRNVARRIMITNRASHNIEEIYHNLAVTKLDKKDNRILANLKMLKLARIVPYRSTIKSKNYQLKNHFRFSS